MDIFIKIVITLLAGIILIMPVTMVLFSGPSSKKNKIEKFLDDLWRMVIFLAIIGFVLYQIWTY